MKNRPRKFLSALLAVLVLLSCVGMLFACNPEEKERERRERDRIARVQSVEIVENVFLSSVNDSWSVDLDNSKLLELDSATDYIVTLYWTKFVGDVLTGSSLQTGKLQTLASVVQSEDGKKLIEDFAENSELILPLLKTVDFTPTDISNLVYDLLCALAKDSGNVFDNIIKKANELREQTGISPAIKQKFGALGVEMSAAKAEFVPTAEECNEMLSAFETAKQPMSELIEFAYNMSIGAITEDIFDILVGGDGALADISNGEIITLIGTLRENVADLKDALDGDALANLNGAFELIIDKFDKGASTSVIYAQIVQYARTAYMLVDIVPFVCDIAYSASGIFMDEALLEEIKSIADKELNEYSQFANRAILTAKVVMNVTDNFSRATFEELINYLCEQSKGDYRKSLPVALVDAMLNISDIYGALDKEDFDNLVVTHPDIMDYDTLGILINTLGVTLGSSVEKFKAAYDKYNEVIASQGDSQWDSNAVGAAYGRLVEAASFFKSFGINNPNTTEDVRVWAEWYLASGLRELNKIVDELSITLKQDIFAFFEDFYVENSAVRAAVEDLANMPLVSENLTENGLKKYMDLLVKGRIVGFMYGASLE